MSVLAKKSDRRISRLACETLETRSLLSVVHVAHHVSTLGQATVAYQPTKSPLLSSIPSTPQIKATTAAANGDNLPAGVAIAPANFPKGGILKAGQTLVTDLTGNATNNSKNSAGDATSIFRINAAGDSTLFAETPAGTGLAGGIAILSRGFVVVGNFPGAGGGVSTGPGSLLFLNANGKLVEQFTSPKIDGPYTLTINDQGSHAQIFVANQDGTVVRFNVTFPKKGNPIGIDSGTQVASGYSSTGGYLSDLGPAGLAYDSRSDTLYVASTGDNAIYSVHHAGKTKGSSGRGSVVFADPTYLGAPLGLVLGPNGDLITSNGDTGLVGTPVPNELIEFTTKGAFVAQHSLDPGTLGVGAGFGLAISSTKHGATLVAVDELLEQVEFFQVGKP